MSSVTSLRRPWWLNIADRVWKLVGELGCISFLRRPRWMGIVWRAHILGFCRVDGGSCAFPRCCCLNLGVRLSLVRLSGPIRLVAQSLVVHEGRGCPRLSMILARGISHSWLRHGGVEARSSRRFMMMNRSVICCPLRPGDVGV